jgi:hypothetical protein
MSDARGLIQKAQPILSLQHCQAIGMNATYCFTYKIKPDGKRLP